MAGMRSWSATRKQLLARSRILVLAALCCITGQGTLPAKKPPPAKPIDINAATIKELEELPGVGPTTAKAIVLFRMRSGRFRRVDDLLAIRGISETKLKNLRRYVTLGPPPVTSAPSPASKKSP